MVGSGAKFVGFKAVSICCATGVYWVRTSGPPAAKCWLKTISESVVHLEPASLSAKDCND